MHSGSCHCGAVLFRIDWEVEELTTCDCSICVKRNAVMARVPERALTIVQGEADLTPYDRNTRRAKHYFCRHRGIYVFHRKRATPDHFGEKVFCLDNFDAASVAVRPTEGANMTVNELGARPEWPGPRIA